MSGALGFCEACRWWDTSAQSSTADRDTTGQCRGAVPIADDRTGLAVWPFTDAYDWCRAWEQDPPDEEGGDDALPF